MTLTVNVFDLWQPTQPNAGIDNVPPKRDELSEGAVHEIGDGSG
ncbi:MAG: hypothetical protein ACR2RL_08070 [Gammaproteobacteria bacterium]